MMGHDQEVDGRDSLTGCPVFQMTSSPQPVDRHLGDPAGLKAPAFIDNAGARRSVTEEASDKQRPHAEDGIFGKTASPRAPTPRLGHGRAGACTPPPPGCSAPRQPYTRRNSASAAISQRPFVHSIIVTSQLLFCSIALDYKILFSRMSIMLSAVLKPSSIVLRERVHMYIASSRHRTLWR